MQPPESTNADAQPLRPHQLTWAALLGRWLDFAKSALALPRDAVGEALRQSVPDIIMLQAVCCALQGLADLPADERALGLDRAELLIDKHAAALRQRWADGPDSARSATGPLPPQLLELIDDARANLAAAQGDQA